jgi:hypothetical protein
MSKLIKLPKGSACLTEPKSSSERVENGPTVSLTGRWARTITTDSDRCTLVGSWNHWLEYASQHTAALCGFTNTGVLTSSLQGCQLLRSYSVVDRWISNEKCWNDTDRRNRSTGEEPVPVPLRPPEIPRTVVWNGVWDSAVRGWRLTVGVMALPGD